MGSTSASEPERDQGKAQVTVCVPDCPVCCEELGHNGGPTTLPCGHNGCLACLVDTQSCSSHCPDCDKRFSRRLNLQVNTELHTLMQHATPLAGPRRPCTRSRKRRRGTARVPDCHVQPTASESDDSDSDEDPSSDDLSGEDSHDLSVESSGEGNNESLTNLTNSESESYADSDDEPAVYNSDDIEGYSEEDEEHSDDDSDDEWDDMCAMQAVLAMAMMMNHHAALLHQFYGRR